MNLTLKIWRQKNTNDKGGFSTYSVDGISEDMSFLEMFDVLNERLINKGEEPVAFDHDCREGICGMCSMFINGRAHGPWEGPPPASCTCVPSKTAIPLPWNRGEQKDFLY
jgi:succinate dehydrogenase / fumarate reductase iron-sulfur subunit